MEELDLLTTAFYGIIQGVTEFLPVSSSAHLALFPHFFKIQDPGLIFDLALHVGTALAVLVYFRKEVMKLVLELLKVFSKKKSKNSFYLYNCILTTIVTILMAFLLKNYAEKNRSNVFIAMNLAIFGFLMWYADYKGKKESTFLMKEKTQWWRASFIGLAQGLALFPGVSRSGMTLTVARWSGLSREEASSYSFLLSIPIILGGFVFELPAAMKENHSFHWMTCLWGILISFMTGLLSIHFFLKLIKNWGLGIFALYRFILALLVLII